MATLTTIPTQEGTEIIRVLLAVHADQLTGISDIRGSQSNCTLTGDAVFDGSLAGLTLDGIQPLTIAYGGTAGTHRIRLRHTGGFFSTWRASNAPRLKAAFSQAGDTVVEFTEVVQFGNPLGISIGGGYWNWEVSGLTGLTSLPAGNNNIALVMWIPSAINYSDVSFRATAGSPTATIVPDGVDINRDVAFSATAGSPTATIVPDSASINRDVSFSAIAGSPTASFVPDNVDINRDVAFAATAGIPTATFAPIRETAFSLDTFNIEGLNTPILAFITAGVPENNGTIFRASANGGPLGAVSSDSDLEAQTNQSITRIALGIQGTGNIRLWSNPSTLAWSNFFTVNPDLTVRFQTATAGPFTLTRASQGVSFSNWGTSNTAARTAIDGIAEGDDFIIALAEQNFRDVTFSATAGSPTATFAPERALITTRDVAFSATAGAPTATFAPEEHGITVRDVAFSAQAGSPTATFAPEEHGITVRDVAFSPRGPATQQPPYPLCSPLWLSGTWHSPQLRVHLPLCCPQSMHSSPSVTSPSPRRQGAQQRLSCRRSMASPSVMSRSVRLRAHPPRPWPQSRRSSQSVT